MAVLLSNVSNALQKVIMPYIRDNFPKQTILLDQLKRNAGVTFMNDNFYAPIRTSRNAGVVSLGNDGASTLSGASSIGQASVGVKILTGAFDISKLAIDATKTAKGAVENQLTWQAKALASDFARAVNRQMYSDGVGIVSQVSVAGTGTFVVVASDGNLDDGRSIDHYGTINNDISPTKYIHAGAVLGFGTAAATNGTVSSVSGGTISLNSAAVVAAYDSVYLLDGSLTAPGTCEIQGVAAALSSSSGTSTYAGLARSTTGWTPQFGSASEALSLSRMEASYLAAKEYGMMGDQYAIFVNKTLYKKYGDLLTSLRRSVNETDLLGGWTGLEFAVGAGRVGVFLDYDVPDGEVLILNLDTWTICQVDDLSWMESPNGESSLLRIHDSIKYQATMVWFCNMLCLCPAANGRETRKTA